MLYCIVLYYSILYCTVGYGTVLYCTAMYSNITIVLLYSTLVLGGEYKDKK